MNHGVRLTTQPGRKDAIASTGSHSPGSSAAPATNGTRFGCSEKWPGAKTSNRLAAAQAAAQTNRRVTSSPEGGAAAAEATATAVAATSTTPTMNPRAGAGSRANVGGAAVDICPPDRQPAQVC